MELEAHEETASAAYKDELIVVYSYKYIVLQKHILYIFLETSGFQDVSNCQRGKPSKNR